MGPAAYPAVNVRGSGPGDGNRLRGKGVQDGRKRPSGRSSNDGRSSRR